MKQDWSAFISEKMIPVIEEEVKKNPRDTAVNRNQPFKHILGLLRNWTANNIPNGVAGAINSATCDISDRHHGREPTRIGLSDDQSQLVIESNTQMARSLVFNDGIQTKRTNDGVIDHDNYEFTVGELLIVNYNRQEDLTEEENENYNMWPFVCEILECKRDDDDGNDDELLVYEYEEIDVYSKTQQFINKKYRRAVHNGTNGTIKDACVTNFISKSTVLFGKINLTANGYIYLKQLEKYRKNIAHVRKEAEGMEQLLNGEFSQQEDLPLGKNWLKN